jgi:hypothetical protein
LSVHISASFNICCFAIKVITSGTEDQSLCHPNIQFECRRSSMGCSPHRAYLRVCRSALNHRRVCFRRIRLIFLHSFFNLSCSF